MDNYYDYFLYIQYTFKKNTVLLFQKKKMQYKKHSTKFRHKFGEINTAENYIF